MTSIAPEESDQVPFLMLNQVPCAGIRFSFERTPAEQAGESRAADLIRVGEIRRASSSKLREWGMGELLDSVSLLLSELVTNAIRHGSASQVDVHLLYTSSEVRIQVRGGPVDALQVRESDPFGEHGRGLLLVDAVADAWGVDEDGWVWCTIATMVTRAR